MSNADSLKSDHERVREIRSKKWTEEGRQEISEMEKESATYRERQKTVKIPKWKRKTSLLQDKISFSMIQSCRTRRILAIQFCFGSDKTCRFLCKLIHNCSIEKSGNVIIPPLISNNHLKCADIVQPQIMKQNMANCWTSDIYSIHNIQQYNLLDCNKEISIVKYL